MGSIPIATAVHICVLHIHTYMQSTCSIIHLWEGYFLLPCYSVQIQWSHEGFCCCFFSSWRKENNVELDDRVVVFHLPL